MCPWCLQADIYSFGVTLWEVLERKRPYKGMDPYQIQVRCVAGCSSCLVADHAPASSTALWVAKAAT